MLNQGNDALKKGALADAMAAYFSAFALIPPLPSVACGNIRYAGLLNKRSQFDTWFLLTTTDTDAALRLCTYKSNTCIDEKIILRAQAEIATGLRRTIIANPASTVVLGSCEPWLLAYGVAYRLIWQSDVFVAVSEDAKYRLTTEELHKSIPISGIQYVSNAAAADLVPVDRYLREQNSVSFHALLSFALDEEMVFLIENLQEHIKAGQFNVLTQADQEAEYYYRLMLALRQWMLSFSTRDRLSLIANLFIGRELQPHESAHYEGMIERGEASPFDIARTISVSEEAARFLGSEQTSALERFTLDPEIQQILHSVRPSGIVIPMVENPIVSVVIPVYGKIEYTLMCLGSIAQHWPDVKTEILILDDRSPDDTVEILSRIPNVRVVQNQTNLGFLRSCNAGVAQAKGKYVFLLNNDTRVTPGWLDAQYDLIRSDDSIGLTGAKLVYPDGKLQEAGGIVWNDASAWNYGRGQNPNDPAFNYIRDVDYCSGAAILFEKSFFVALGSFDDRYAPAYYEDTDFAFKVRASGKRVVYQPRSCVVHYEGISHGKHTDSGLKAYQVENRKKFFEKWRNELSSNHFANAQRVFRAKERSKNRPVLLMIDHQIPQPDRDAGSKSMWFIIQTFINQGWLVKFWPHNHYYHPEYSKWLEQEGVEVLAGDRFVGQFEKWYTTFSGELNAVFLSRPIVAPHYLKILMQNRQIPVLYYGHDIHYLRLRAQLNIKEDSAVRAEMNTYLQIEHEIWKNAPVIYYPSVDEEKYVSEWQQNHGVFKSICRTIPLYAYEPRKDLEQPTPIGRHDIAFVAGFGHPPNIDAACWFVNDVLPLVLQRYPTVRLKLVGSNPGERVTALASESVIVTGFVSEEELAKVYRSIRVIVAPLRFGGGMKGKILEALYNGVPCVTTSTGQQGLQATSAFLNACDDPQQMADWVIKLLDDDATWTACSAAGLKFIAENFSRQTLWNVISPDLRLNELLEQS